MLDQGSYLKIRRKKVTLWQSTIFSFRLHYLDSAIFKVKEDLHLPQNIRARTEFVQRLLEKTLEAQNLNIRKIFRISNTLNFSCGSSAPIKDSDWLATTHTQVNQYELWFQQWTYTNIFNSWRTHMRNHCHIIIHIQTTRLDLTTCRLSVHHRLLALTNPRRSYSG